MLKWRPFRSTLTFARKLVLALASVCVYATLGLCFLAICMWLGPALHRVHRGFAGTRTVNARSDSVRLFRIRHEARARSADPPQRASDPGLSFFFDFSLQ